MIEIAIESACKQKGRNVLTITPIPALQNNYIWSIINKQTNQCLVVDPGDATPVLRFLQEHNLELTSVWITHHHCDHTGGIAALLKHYSIPIYGPKNEKIPHLTHPLQEGNYIPSPIPSLDFEVLDIPGHTHGHIAYYHTGYLFPGDTLFGAGCGRVFEGTNKQMLHSLEKLAQLSNETLLYPAHEYTLSNLYFAEAVEPNNRIIQERIKICKQLKQDQHPTLPSTIGLEKASNPFLRAHLPNIIHSAKQKNPSLSNELVDVWQTIRQWKNRFSA